MGLFGHYWVLLRVLLTVLAVIIRLQSAQTVSYFRGRGTARPCYIGGLSSYVLRSGAGLLVLFVTTILSLYKPQSMTPYERTQHEKRIED